MEALSEIVSDVAETVVEALAGVSDFVELVVRTLEKAAVVLLSDLVEICLLLVEGFVQLPRVEYKTSANFSLTQ